MLVRSIPEATYRFLTMDGLCENRLHASNLCDLSVNQTYGVLKNNRAWGISRTHAIHALTTKRVQNYRSHSRNRKGIYFPINSRSRESDGTSSIGRGASKARALPTRSIRG